MFSCLKVKQIIYNGKKFMVTAESTRTKARIVMYTNDIGKVCVGDCGYIDDETNWFKVDVSYGFKISSTY